MSALTGQLPGLCAGGVSSVMARRDNVGQALMYRGICSYSWKGLPVSWATEAAMPGTTARCQP
jgi:hypothetical protein